MKNVDTDSHIKISTKYFKINQFERQMYHFIAKSYFFWLCIVGLGIGI